MELVECCAQCQTPGVPQDSNLAKFCIGLARLASVSVLYDLPEMPGGIDAFYRQNSIRKTVW